MQATNTFHMDCSFVFRWVIHRPVTRGWSAPRKIFSPLGKCVGQWT